MLLRASAVTVACIIHFGTSVQGVTKVFLSEAIKALEHLSPHHQSLAQLTITSAQATVTLLGTATSLFTGSDSNLPLLSQY